MEQHPLIDYLGFIFNQFIAFIIGVISGLLVELILYVFLKSTSMIKLQRMLSIAILNANLRHVHGINDPHAIIRGEWSNNLRDIGSNKRNEVLLALESLKQMADVLENDERKVAFEALRLRIGRNEHREDDQKFLRVMDLLL